MKDNITLGQVKARCAELTGKYGNDCCKHCEFSEISCCDSPDRWVLEETGCTGQPNWEEMFHRSEEECAKLAHKAHDSYERAERSEAENRNLRIIVSVMETMLGRKFDVS